MTDQQAIDTWIYSQLSGDAALVALATGGIYNVAPPAGISPPYVVWNAIPQGDGLTNGYIRWSAHWFVTAQFVCIDATTGSPTAETAAGYIDQDLFTVGVSSNAYWITCNRQRNINLAPTNADKVLYRYRGGYYDIMLRPESQPV